MKISITKKDWAFAAMLGEARRRSNENKRNSSRDRGRDKNIQNDLMGSLGEILSLKLYSKYMSHENYKKHVKHLFGVGGGAFYNDADCYLDLHPKQIRLDVKTFDCEKNKKYFAINSRKHNKLNGNCSGYSCFIIPKYSTSGYLVPNVPYTDVSNWDLRSLGGYGDPSYNMNICLFSRRYLDDIDVMKDIHKIELYSKEDIRNEIHSPNTISEFSMLAPDAIELLRLKTH